MLGSSGCIRPIYRSGNGDFFEFGAEIFSGYESVKTYEKKIAELECLLGRNEVELALLGSFMENR